MADFGLSEDVYSSGGYFCRSKEEVVAREEKVPIRWMAPESIETGKHSEKTDVVRPYIKDAHNYNYSTLRSSDRIGRCYIVCMCLCVYSGHLELHAGKYSLLAVSHTLGSVP